ncbi:hypothetical protein WMF31_11960 [Sorangium sp. So ce1036]|uniref:hypothetical protein n=1 Tax=Sorangium sp. So ce1036 TaxID=3133328 RepID=UPI003F0BE5F3
MRGLLCLLSALALVGIVAAGGCGSEEPCGKPWDPCPVVNPDGTSNGVCWGKCVFPDGPGFFSPPLLLWMGPEESEPSCTDLMADDPDTGEPQSFVPVTFTKLRSSRPSEEFCGECNCRVTSCGLPRTVAANSLWSCAQIPEATNTPFNPPHNWNGRCTSPGTVPSSRVGSIWIGPMLESFCEPIVRHGPPSQEGPAQVAVACLGTVVDRLCPNRFDACMLNQQEAHVPPGWRYCVVAQVEGDQGCHPPAPPGERPMFSEKFLFYKRDPSDPQNCEPCGCVTTTPGRCAARVSAYADSACSDSALIGTAEVALGEGNACVPLDPGPALGSLSAEWVVKEDPHCTPVGGKPKPTVVCCLPEPEE